MAIPPLVLRVVADSSGVKRGVVQAQQQVGGLKSTIQKNSALIKTALIGGFAVGLKVAVDAAREANTAQLSLQNSIQNSSKVSAGAAQAFTEQANALRDLTGVDDEAIIGAQSFLVQMGLTETQVKSLTPLITDLSVKLGVDMTTAAKAVGKAVNGNVGGLQRMGVVVDKAKAATDPYVATLDALGVAQGFAAKQAKAEPWRVLQAQFEELMETVGQAVIPFMKVLAGVLKAILPVLRQLGPLLVAAAAGFAAWWTVGKIAALLAWATSFAPALTGIALAASSVGGPLALVAAGLGLVVIKLTDSHTRFTEFRDDLVALGATLPEAKKKADELKTGIEGAAVGARFAGRRMEILKQETARNAEVAEGWAAKQKQVAAATDRSTDATKRETRSLGALRQARLALAGGLLGVVSQLNTLRGAQKDVNDLEKAGKKGTQEYKDAKLVLLQEIVATKSGLAEYGQELRKEGQTYPQVKRALVNLGREYGLTRQDVLGVLDVVKGVNAEWARTPRTVRTHYDVTATVNGKQARDDLISHIILEGRQAGGPVMPGQPYIVGEQGPELFIPRQSGTVVPNGELPAAGGVTVVVNGDVWDADRFAQKVEAAVNRAASRH